MKCVGCGNEKRVWGSLLCATCHYEKACKDTDMRKQFTAQVTKTWLDKRKERQR